jgi:uncharacterized protein involved in exopolysaccharide biosynthesis
MNTLTLPAFDEEDTKSVSSGQSFSDQSVETNDEQAPSSGSSSSDESDLRDRILQRSRWCVGVSFLVIAVSVTTAVYFFSDARSFEIEVSISGVASDEQN